MKHFFITATLAMAFSTIVVAAKSSHRGPGCASQCWTNSKYVSTCADEIKCLCEDDAFQSTVFQCLYTQCQTNHFGPALHYALSACTEFDSGGMVVFPHLIRQQGLMKRQDYNTGIVSGYVSGSASGHASIYGSGSTMGSVTTRRFLTVPGSAYPRPTQIMASSNFEPEKGLTTGLSMTASTPTIFALSPTVPVVTATPKAIDLDSTGP